RWLWCPLPKAVGGGSPRSGRGGDRVRPELDGAVWHQALDRVSPGGDVRAEQQRDDWDVLHDLSLNGLVKFLPSLRVEFEPGFVYEIVGGGVTGEVRTAPAGRRGVKH